MNLLSVFLSLLFSLGALGCSLPPNVPFYSLTDRTVLAPLVIHGRVLNISVPRQGFNQIYKACVKLLRVIKGDNDLPPEICFGNFGAEHLCLTDVYEGTEYIFFMNEDHTARYEGIPRAAVYASDQSLALADKGYCINPYTDSSCELPKIKRNEFKSVVRVREGRTVQIPCSASGSTPLIYSWTKKDNRYFLPSVSRSMFLYTATMSDTGVYVCTVRNRAGKTSALVRLIVDPEPCGQFVALKPGQRKPIQSPNFPRPYPQEKMCSWRICPARGQRVELSFKTYDLRWKDSLEIYHECDLTGSDTLKYCSSNPGTHVSVCHSSCVQVWFNSAMEVNHRAKGFQAMVSSTSRGKTIFDYGKLYCENQYLLKLVTKVVYTSTVRGKVLYNYKESGPEAGNEMTISIDFPAVNVFGCQISIQEDKEYYVGVSISNGKYELKFAMLTNSHQRPVKFEEHLHNYKVAVPACSPRVTGPPRPRVRTTGPPRTPGRPTGPPRTPGRPTGPPRTPAPPHTPVPQHTPYPPRTPGLPHTRRGRPTQPPERKTTLHPLDP